MFTEDLHGTWGPLLPENGMLLLLTMPESQGIGHF